MIVCFICKESISCYEKVFFKHLKTVHDISERNARYTCCQEQCCQTFCNKYGFLRHIKLCHPGAVDPKSVKNVHPDTSHTVSKALPVTNVQIESGVVDKSAPDQLKMEKNLLVTWRVGSYVKVNEACLLYKV
jgi:hypothetical protein